VVAGKMTTRAYRSPARAEAREQTRQRILAAATSVLQGAGASGFSLETVAKAAAVTRLTVYNQFGSRRALLEAVFDARAVAGGLGDLPAAMSQTDPAAGLVRLIEIFCAFWDSDRASFGALFAAASADPELEASLGERNERRRRAIAVLVDRMIEASKVSASARADLVDLLFVLTSFAVFAQLSAGRSLESTCRLIRAACADAVARASEVRM
jgi:AcrR family transcriptional regulator